jgi:hypothetical protein
MVDMKDLRPAFLRLLPSFRVLMEELPLKRQLLQSEVREVVKKYGPSLGELYYEKDIALDQYIQKVYSTLNMVSVL